MAKPILKKRKCWLWFPIRFTKYEVKQQFDDIELVITTGLLAKREEKIKLYRINDISYHRSVGNFFFGVGNLTISSSDRTSSTTEITKIRRYKKFGNKLEELIYNERKRVGVSYSEANIVK